MKPRFKFGNAKHYLISKKFEQGWTVIFTDETGSTLESSANSPRATMPARCVLWSRRCCLVSKKIESFFGGFKRECVNLLEFNGLEDVLVNVPTFLEEVYNAKQLHSSIGYLPSVEFEALVRAESAAAEV